MKRTISIIIILGIVAVGIVLMFLGRNNPDQQGEELTANGVAVESSFPNFSVSEVDGTQITNNSLKGKPAIVWFTTEFCVPCQIGAKEVARLDDELGGNAFDVLVIFVDPRETEEDLTSWRDRFANPDWMVAFDNFEEASKSLSEKVGLQFLDSKYLLDKDGIIKDIDFNIADERYLDAIKQVIAAQK